MFWLFTCGELNIDYIGFLVLICGYRGTYKCAKAVWPVFQKQKYGRIVTTASGVGICKCLSMISCVFTEFFFVDGNFGQANVSSDSQTTSSYLKVL
jgi:multifunctional beta-oxidation protein